MWLSSSARVRPDSVPKNRSDVSSRVEFFPVRRKSPVVSGRRVQDFDAGSKTLDSLGRLFEFLSQFLEALFQFFKKSHHIVIVKKVIIESVCSLLCERISGSVLCTDIDPLQLGGALRAIVPSL